MPEAADELLRSLLRSRNPDGGWPSRCGASWTEPTALALLALQTAQSPPELRATTVSWLADRQAADGGWPPCQTVQTSTWVTTLALLALSREKGHELQCARAVPWVAEHVYPELSTLQRLLTQTFNIAPGKAPGSAPWFPGTAGWVIPTSFSALALEFWGIKMSSQDLRQKAFRAQSYLLSRRCADGGWNHGGSLARSEDSTSYGETTGLAITALASRSSSIKSAITLGAQLLQQAESTESQCWLSIGLAACGICTPEPVWKNGPRTTQEAALRIIVSHVLRGRNPFLPVALA